MCPCPDSSILLAPDPLGSDISACSVIFLMALLVPAHMWAFVDQGLLLCSPSTPSLHWSLSLTGSSRKIAQPAGTWSGGAGWTPGPGTVKLRIKRRQCIKIIWVPCFWIRSIPAFQSWRSQCGYLGYGGSRGGFSCWNFCISQERSKISFLILDFFPL